MAVLIALDYVHIAISPSGRLFCYHDTSCSILHAGCYRCIADKPYVILLYYWFYSLKNWTSALDAVSCCITRRLISCRCCADECRYITMQTKPFMPVRHRQFSYINVLKSSQVISNDETINFLLPTQNDRTLPIAMIRLAEKHQRIVFWQYFSA